MDSLCYLRTRIRSPFAARWLAAAVVAMSCLVITMPTQAAVFVESEPNDTKFAADAVGPMTAGDAISGTTTGSSTLAGINSADNFLVSIASASPGIYRHRLVINSLTPTHNGTIHGLTQTGGVANSGTDTIVQFSVITNASLPYNQFYTFGAASQFYYRVVGSATTTNSYTATLETVPITPTNIGSFNSGSINISTTNQSPVTDTDFWVYDQNFHVVPGYGNDDNSVIGGGSGLLIRSYTTGTYYLAISSFDLCNEQTSPPDDSFRSGNILDFAGVAVNSDIEANLNLTFQITDGTKTLQVTNTKTSPYNINWFMFTIGPRPQINLTFKSGTNVVIAGTNGSPSGTYYVRASTNLALPLLQWTRVATNLFDGNGNFRHTNAINTTLSARYFCIDMPP